MCSYWHGATRWEPNPNRRLRRNGRVQVRYREAQHCGGAQIADGVSGPDDDANWVDAETLLRSSHALRVARKSTGVAASPGHVRRRVQRSVGDRCLGCSTGCSALRLWELLGVLVEPPTSECSGSSVREVARGGTIIDDEEQGQWRSASWAVAVWRSRPSGWAA